MITLPQSPECCDFRCASAYLAHYYIFVNDIIALLGITDSLIAISASVIALLLTLLHMQSVI